MRNTPSPSARSGSGKVLAGSILILVGAILLLQHLDLFFFPGWLFSWPMILIVIGVLIGAKHQFRNPAWFILVIIGSVFLFERFYPMINASRYIWPILFIAIGLYLILGRQRHHHYRYNNWQDPNRSNPGPGPDRPDGFTTDPTQPDGSATGGGTSGNFANGSTAGYASNAFSGDYLNSTSVFGGVKKNIISKNFQGGEIITFLGGADINLSQADINGRVILDVTQVMGGTRIIVPPHWNVVSEVAAIFGGVEDKRILQPGTINPDKVLVIRGTSFMGGIDIRSF